MKWVFACLLLLLPVAARAQMYQVIIPTSFAGQGTMAVTSSSSQMIAANVTTSPGSLSFPQAGTPLPTGVLRVKNQASSGNNATVCWLGGPATATNCEVIAPGESRTVVLPAFAAQVPTAISTGATLELEW